LGRKSAIADLGHVARNGRQCGGDLPFSRCSMSMTASLLNELELSTLSGNSQNRKAAAQRLNSPACVAFRTGPVE
jgi:hypothetical protein